MKYCGRLRLGQTEQDELVEKKEHSVTCQEGKGRGIMALKTPLLAKNSQM